MAPAPQTTPPAGPHPRTENPVGRALSGAARISCIIGGWALVGLSAMVGLEVVLRRVFNASLQGADEIGGYVVAVVVAFGAAAALLDRAHTRIDIFIAFLPEGARAVLNAVAAVAMAALAAFLCLRGIAALRDSVVYGSLSGTPLQTPLWLPQAVWVAGLAFFALVAIGVAAHCAVLLSATTEPPSTAGTARGRSRRSWPRSRPPSGTGCARPAKGVT